MRRLVHCHDHKCLPEVTDFECRVSADPATSGQASLCRWVDSTIARYRSQNLQSGEFSPNKHYGILV